MKNGQFIDPICGMNVDPATAAGSYNHGDVTSYFCSQGCLKKFIQQTEGAPKQPVTIEPRSKNVAHGDMEAKPGGTFTDPVCGMTVDPANAAAEYEYNGTTYYFCAVRCKERFAADPESFLSVESNADSESRMSVPSAVAGGFDRDAADGGRMPTVQSQSQIPNPNSQITLSFLRRPRSSDQ